jgi:hypothetical protein
MAIIGSDDTIVAPKRRSTAHSVSAIATKLFRLSRAGLAQAALLLIVSVLAGCAGSVSSPTAPTTPIPGYDPSAARIGEVSAEASRGVVMTKEDLDRISHRVQAEPVAVYPDRIVIQGDPSPSGNVNVRMVFTEYDEGNAFTRFMLAGLGKSELAPMSF